MEGSAVLRVTEACRAGSCLVVREDEVSGQQLQLRHDSTLWSCALVKNVMLQEVRWVVLRCSSVTNRLCAVLVLHSTAGGASGRRGGAAASGRAAVRRRQLKKFMLVTPADHWPHVDSGLSMKAAGGPGGVVFVFEGGGQLSSQHIHQQPRNTLCEDVWQDPRPAQPLHLWQCHICTHIQREAHLQAGSGRHMKAASTVSVAFLSVASCLNAWWCVDSDNGVRPGENATCRQWVGWGPGQQGGVPCQWQMRAGGARARGVGVGGTGWT
jgi:hypothetical protein